MSKCAGGSPAVRQLCRRVLVMHRESDSEVYYYAHDHLYSVVALIDDTGTVVERYEYDAYGKAHILSSAYSVLSSTQYGNPYFFTGRRLDTLDNGNLLTMHYRPYTARFLQHDSFAVVPPEELLPLLQYWDGMNLYQYVLGKPVHISDPWGLMFDPIIITISYCQAEAELIKKLAEEYVAAAQKGWAIGNQCAQQNAFLLEYIGNNTDHIFCWTFDVVERAKRRCLFRRFGFPGNHSVVYVTPRKKPKSWGLIGFTLDAYKSPFETITCCCPGFKKHALETKPIPEHEEEYPCEKGECIWQIFENDKE